MGPSDHKVERPRPSTDSLSFRDVALCSTGSPLGRGGRVQAVETEEVVAGVMMDSVMDASKMVRGGGRESSGSRDERLIWRCCLSALRLFAGLGKPRRRLRHSCK